VPPDTAAGPRGLQERARELVAVLLGHAEEVGDDQHRERAGEPSDVLPLAADQEAVEQAIGICHMDASFSLRRFGVINRISKDDEGRYRRCAAVRRARVRRRSKPG
jgi:hypothetical protein